jgi:hypothetical protein
MPFRPARATIRLPSDGGFHGDNGRAVNRPVPGSAAGRMGRPHSAPLNRDRVRVANALFARARRHLASRDFRRPYPLLQIKSSAAPRAGPTAALECPGSMGKCRTMQDSHRDHTAAEHQVTGQESLPQPTHRHPDKGRGPLVQIQSGPLRKDRFRHAEAPRQPQPAGRLGSEAGGAESVEVWADDVERQVDPR